MKTIIVSNDICLNDIYNEICFFTAIILWRNCKERNFTYLPCYLDFSGTKNIDKTQRLREIVIIIKTNEIMFPSPSEHPRSVRTAKSKF